MWSEVLEQWIKKREEDPNDEKEVLGLLDLLGAQDQIGLKHQRES